MLSSEKVFNSSLLQDVCSSPAHLHHHRHNVKSRYEFLKTLGKGTYGKVKLARHKETNKLVAVKAIKKEKIKDSADMKHIRREIEIMSSIQHLHIIQIYEVFENQDKIVIVMEYASGGELYDYLAAKGGISNDEAKSFFRQIVSAVRYCHSHGIVHRDLKLENILLDQDNRIKIADFGLANSFKPDSLLETFCGSPLYASPEIVCGIKYKGPEVDSWSLGVLLYALMYGTMPFDGRNYQILTKQITSGIVLKPPVLSEAHELICWMLTVDPKHRASIEDIAAHDWVRGSDEPLVQVAPSCTQEALSYNRYLEKESLESDDSDAVDHFKSSLGTKLADESLQIKQPRGILKQNGPATAQSAPAEQLPAKPDIVQPQVGSEKRKVFKSRRDRESGYYSSPEHVAPIYVKVNSSDPTLHPNITPNPQVNGFLAPPGTALFYCGQQCAHLYQSSVPVNIPKNCYLIPTNRNERLTSVGSDDCSSAEGQTRPVSTCSDSSILSTDSFDLCTFEGCLLQHNGVTHPLVTQPIVTQPINNLSPQRPLSLDLVRDTLPPVDPTAFEEHPSGSLTPKSEKLVRDLERILAPSGRRKQVIPNNVPPNHTQSLGTQTQFSHVMNKLNVDIDLAYKKALLDICASLKSAEV